MHGQFETFFVAVVLGEEQIFRSKHSLAAYIVGVHTFPTSRYCATVEYDLKTIVVGITQYILVQFHCFLFVTTEEIHFDTLDTDTFEPSHFLLAYNRSVHTVAW